MNNFAIIADSSCDLTKALRERFGVDALIRGIVYKPDGTQIFADVDWETTTPEEYFRSMQGRKVLYKTATPPVGEIREVFEKFLKEDKDILSISLSTGISGTFQIVQNTANELLKEYPERKIICVDSLRYASASGLLVSLACRKRDTGASIEETAEYLNTTRHTIHQMGPLDDLFFCAKTGRITNTKAFFGTLIGVNSLADFSNKGLSAMLGKIKGKPNALRVTVEYVCHTIKNPEEQIIFISHSDREEYAQMLAQELKVRLNPKDIIINPIGMSCGSSIGPGLYAAYYLGDPISDGEEIERKILESILKK